jgi:tetratricopeptide (TPR) repeat protein
MIDIEGFLGSINTYDFNYQARNALYFKAYLENDLDRMIDLSKDAVAFFKTKEGFLKLGEFSFLQKLGIAYQARKEYSNALDVYHQAFKLNPREGNTPWYNIRNHIFNVHLHLREYQEAYKYLLEATSHKSFKQLYNLSKEPWILKEAYMHLLIKMGKVAEDKDSKHKLRPFRLSRFLNEVEHFSKDKRGLNIAVNIIHALFLFLQKKDDEFERRLAALGQYSFRYLRRDETLRSNAFIKMLQKLPDAGFHPLRVKRYTDKYYKRMVEAPMVIQENSKEVEIIPYEHLWEIVLELLEMRLNKEI